MEPFARAVRKSSGLNIELRELVLGRSRESGGLALSRIGGDLLESDVQLYAMGIFASGRLSVSTANAIRNSAEGHDKVRRGFCRWNRRA